jgi:hypothetical protein
MFSGPFDSDVTMTVPSAQPKTAVAPEAEDPMPVILREDEDLEVKCMCGEKELLMVSSFASVSETFRAFLDAERVALVSITLSATSEGNAEEDAADDSGAAEMAGSPALLLLLLMLLLLLLEAVRRSFFL